MREGHLTDPDDEDGVALIAVEMHVYDDSDTAEQFAERQAAFEEFVQVRDVLFNVCVVGRA